MLPCIEKVLNIALAEEGYLEKKSNSQLYDKTANAGSNNWTKYAADLDKIDGFYNGKKNGYAWCTMFVDWCFVQAFGATLAQKVLNQPGGSSDYGAGVYWSAKYLMDKNRWFTSNPQPGDQIFLASSTDKWAHTALVYKVDSSRVYTIEGNTSAGNDVVIPNGGAVARKSYALGAAKITGYARPLWHFVDGTGQTNTYSGNRYLTAAEMQVNARYIYQYLSNKGWTLNAIAGLLGNVEAESTINPGIWQSLNEGNTSGGYGLTQWTPASKYISWCSQNKLEKSEMDSALKRIEYELERGEQFYKTDDYNITFAEFAHSTETPFWLACAFAWNYERSAVVLYGTEAEKEALKQKRGGLAEKWYNYLVDYYGGTGGGSGGGGGGYIPPDDPNWHKPGKMPFLLLMLSTGRRS